MSSVVDSLAALEASGVTYEDIWKEASNRYQDYPEQGMAFNASQLKST
jgi:hypothetical protein